MIERNAVKTTLGDISDRGSSTQILSGSSAMVRIRDFKYQVHAGGVWCTGPKNKTIFTKANGAPDLVALPTMPYSTKFYRMKSLVLLALP